MTLSRSKLTSFLLLSFCVFAFSGGAVLRLSHAQSVKEKTLNHNGSTINVKVIAPAEVIKVKPYIKTKKGKDTGRLHIDVVLKNTASEPQSYAVFGQGKTDTGGWLGGMNKVPKKGKLDPGKETTFQIRTGYEGKDVPREIRVEVFPPQ